MAVDTLGGVADSPVLLAGRGRISNRTIRSGGFRFETGKLTAGHKGPILKSDPFSRGVDVRRHPALASNAGLQNAYRTETKTFRTPRVCTSRRGLTGQLTDESWRCRYSAAACTIRCAVL
jgi:hypothetical protein